MSADDRLLELRHLPDEVQPPPIATVLREGRRMRHRRSVTKAAGTATVLLGLVSVSVLLLDEGGARTARVYAAGPSLAGIVPSTGACRGLPEEETRDDPRLHYTLATPPAGMRLVHHGAGTGEWCAPSATPLVALDIRADGSVRRALAVWGPSADPSALGDATGTRRVRGADARVWTVDGHGAVAVAWTEPDGSRWFTSSAGLKEEELLRLVGALSLDGASGTATLPDADLAGLTVEDSVADAAPPRFQTTWTLLYRTADGPARDLTVVVTRSGPAFLAEAAWPGSRATVVGVRGQRGLYLPPPDEAEAGDGMLLWNEAGNTLRLLAPNPTRDPTALVRLAEQLSPPPVG